MSTNSHIISLSISVLMAVLAFLAAYFTMGISKPDLWYVAGASFIISYLISWGVLEILLFKGIRKLLKIPQLGMNNSMYTKEKGKVMIDFTPTRDQVMVHVKDDGRGIPPEHIDRIFQRFYRVEKSRAKSTDIGGTGLGLAIVKHILEQHDSQIRVKSTLDKGSDFYFALPKSDH